LVRTSAGIPSILTEAILCFPQFLQENPRIVPLLRYDRFLSNNLKFIIHHSSSRSTVYRLTTDGAVKWPTKRLRTCERHRFVRSDVINVKCKFYCTDAYQNEIRPTTSSVPLPGPEIQIPLGNLPGETCGQTLGLQYYGFSSCAKNAWNGGRWTKHLQTMHGTSIPEQAMTAAVEIREDRGRDGESHY
jgi:hypothetical protein